MLRELGWPLRVAAPVARPPFTAGTGVRQADERPMPNAEHETKAAGPIEHVRDEMGQQHRPLNPTSPSEGKMAAPWVEGRSSLGEVWHENLELFGSDN